MPPPPRTVSDSGDPDRDAAAFERYIASSVKGVTAAADYLLAPQTASSDRTAGFVFLGTPPARRTEFEQGDSITYKDNATGDNGTFCGSDHCHGAVAAGMVKWNGAPGAHISLVYGGTDASMGGKCLSQLQNQIQYNDPCNEITNLSGCTGTLALGGFSSSTQSGGTPYCPAMGSPSFQKIMYSKITINNGVGACLSQCDYTEMVAHETGHTLGAGHTSVPGSLMLPSLAHGFCGTLRSDDIAFAQCAYPQTDCCDATATKTLGRPTAHDDRPSMPARAPGFSPYTYAWTFGDGGTATAAAPSHAYATASTFTASVTVTDATNETCTDSVDITVLTCKPPTISSVTQKYINGTWRAVVIGKNFKTGTKVEFDSGSGFAQAPTTKYFSATKVVGRDVGAVWPQGVEVTVRAVNPNGCPSNPIVVTR